MRRLILVCVLVLGFTICGCGFLDWATGTDPDPANNINWPENHSPTPVDTAANILNLLLPGAGMLLTGGAAVYKHIRQRQAEGVTKAVVAGVGNLKANWHAVETWDHAIGALKAPLSEMKHGHKAESEINNV